MRTQIELGVVVARIFLVRENLDLGRGKRFTSLDRFRRIRGVAIDVFGDPLDVIGSGPTAADPTTFADALAVLERCGQVPGSVAKSGDAQTHAGDCRYLCCGQED